MKKIVAAVIVVLLLVVGGVLWTKREKSAPIGAETGSSASAARSWSSAPAGRVEETGSSGPAWLAQPGVAARRIAGRVTFRGQPVAGALVELANVATEAGNENEPRRTTDATGAFDFGPQRAMEWTVRAAAPHRASARQDVDLRDPTAVPRPDALELALASCDAALFGTVRDASGGPIPNARIARLADTARPGVPVGFAATSDATGAYELCFEPRWPLWVGLEVSASGYGAVTYRTVAPGRIRADFALVPEATIVGRVVRDETGAPVADAFVFVPAGAPGLVESTPHRGAFTDANGHFQLTGMTAGRHLVSARADGLALSATGVPAIVDVGQTSVEIEIRLETGSTIEGMVVDHGKPLPGVRVRALDGPRVVGTAVSQDGGAFVLHGVPRSEVRFAAQGYDVLAPQTLRVTQPTHAGVRVEVDGLGSIIGQVVRGKDPVPGATIDIHGPNERELEPVIADARGRFEIRGLAPGPWAIAGADDRAGAFGGPKEAIQLARGQTAEVTLDLVFSAAVSGRVVDQTGAPVPGVSVLFRSTATDDVGLTTTLEDGTFRAAMMTGGGEYRPLVKRGIRATTPIPPASGSEFPLITLSDRESQLAGVVLTVRLDHLSIAGKVTDARGAPLADVRVVAELVEGAQAPTFARWTQAPAATTNVDGEFSIEDLLAGTYALRARSAAGVEATVPGVTAGRHDVTVVVPAAGAIEITVAGFATTPQVTAVRLGASSAPTTATGQGTTFALKNLSPGSYSVTARTASEAASAVVEVAAGKTARVALASGGSGTIAGHVREFRSGKPVEGMTCRALPRSGTTNAMVPPGEGVRTDAQGAFVITAAPAGSITVACDGLWRNYSDGQRLITLSPGQRADLEVPVVAIAGEAGAIIAGFGADFDPQLLVPRVVRVVPGGPAAVAGLLEGDVVTTVDNMAVPELSVRGVWMAIVNRPVGSKVKIGATRAGKPIAVEITLGNAPPV